MTLREVGKLLNEVSFDKDCSLSKEGLTKDCFEGAKLRMRC